MEVEKDAEWQWESWTWQVEAESFFGGGGSCIIIHIHCPTFDETPEKWEHKLTLPVPLPMKVMKLHILVYLWATS